MSVTLLNQEVRRICFEGSIYPEQWHARAACPACRDIDLEPAFAKWGFTHRRCKHCGLILLDPFPPDAVLKDLYGGQYYTKVRELFELPRLQLGGEPTALSAPAEVLTELIERLAKPFASGAWLDAGGGFGAFVDHVRRQCPGWQTVLNDRNPRSLQIAQDVLGIETLGDDAEAILATGRRFNVVSAISVLEHMPYPDQFLESYGRLLVPGGFLAVVVPNFTRLNGIVSGASSPAAAPPFHINLFNKQSLRLLIDRVGVFDDVELFDRGSAAFSLMHHMDFADYFDITIPTEAEPAPKTVMVKPYSDEMASRINALAEADGKLGDYFAETDGRMWLIAIARRSGR